MKNKKYGLYTAISLVVANMVGTGVFTSLGFQVLDISSGFSIVLLWLIGGIAALCGALSYAELGASMPRSGGEYFYLSKIYHPGLGFIAGWVSFLVGFAAPVAAASIAFSKYLTQSINFHSFLPETVSASTISSVLAILIIVLISIVHLTNKKTGALFQNSFTTFKVLILVVLIIIGFIYGNTENISFKPDANAGKDIFSPAFAVALYFVLYSYSGWNAAAYIAGEIDRPSRNLPLSLIFGTLIVIVLYVLLNLVFLYAIPINEMAGELEIGYIFGLKIWGTGAGKIMGFIISFLLLSTISSMILTGPRVTQVMGEDYPLFKWLSFKNKRDIPQRAIIIQSIISVIYVLTSTFDQVITFIGFTLNIFAFLTVLGVIINRIKNPDMERPYKTIGYPVIPAIFLIINVWIMAYGLIYKPYESFAGIGVSLIGLLVYFYGKRSINKKSI
ncbi:amino acid permease [Bacteroidota bacterium]